MAVTSVEFPRCHDREETDSIEIISLNNVVCTNFALLYYAG